MAPHKMQPRSVDVSYWDVAYTTALPVLKESIQRKK